MKRNGAELKQDVHTVNDGPCAGTKSYRIGRLFTHKTLISAQFLCWSDILRCFDLESESSCIGEGFHATLRCPVNEHLSGTR